MTSTSLITSTGISLTTSTSLITSVGTSLTASTLSTSAGLSVNIKITTTVVRAINPMINIDLCDLFVFRFIFSGSPIVIWG